VDDVVPAVHDKHRSEHKRVYVVVAIWGFIIGDGDAILSIIPVNTEDNILRLLIGIAGLAAGAATPAVLPREAT
jgi:hypothetical protein